MIANMEFANCIDKSYLFRFKSIFFPLLLLLMAFVLQLYMAMSIGFFSDDYDLLQNALNQTVAYGLHYSPFANFLWKLTAQGFLTAQKWHFFALGLHYLNAFLVFLFIKRRSPEGIAPACYAAAFAAANPLGIEALAWSCCLGYLLTVTWLMIGLFIYDSFRTHTTKLLSRALLLALLQGIAFLSWDWGILLFPILCTMALTETHFWRNTSTRNRWLAFFLPIGLCWCLGVWLRATSEYAVRWQENGLLQISSFALEAPVIGFFPNLAKNLYFSFWGAALALAIYSWMGWIIRKNRMALGLFFCFFVSITPWVLFGNLSGRYFYLSMPFLYMVLALGISTFPANKLLAFSLAALLLLESVWMTTRVELWKGAYQQAEWLKKEIEHLASIETEKPLILVNLPEAYGPESLVMRPQIWFGGLNTFIPDMIALRMGRFPFVWQGGTTDKFLTKETIVFQYAEKPIYQIFYQNEGDWRSFKLERLQHN